MLELHHDLSEEFNAALRKVHPFLLYAKGQELEKLTESMRSLVRSYNRNDGSSFKKFFAEIDSQIASLYFLPQERREMENFKGYLEGIDQFNLALRYRVEELETNNKEITEMLNDLTEEFLSFKENNTTMIEELYSSINQLNNNVENRTAVSNINTIVDLIPFDKTDKYYNSKILYKKVYGFLLKNKGTFYTNDEISDELKIDPDKIRNAITDIKRRHYPLGSKTDEIKKRTVYGFD